MDEPHRDNRRADVFGAAEDREVMIRRVEARLGFRVVR